MNRPLAFVCALLLAFITVSSACIAQPADWVRFSLEPERGNPMIKMGSGAAQPCPARTEKNSRVNRVFVRRTKLETPSAL